MSILIRGMKMPKDCPACPMSYWNAGGSFSGCDVVGGKRYAMDDEEYRNSSTRPEWCPLVELPPHGDLIERSAANLTDFEIAVCDGNFREGMIMLVEKIESAPAIIPADKEGEG